MKAYGRPMDRPDASTTAPQRTRAINRRQQGDLGEASAIECFTRGGWTVWTPVGHSPDADLVVSCEQRTLRVQVKTSTVSERRRDGTPRWSVSLAINGGNQSWSGVAKLFDPSRFDLLFVIVGDGRRWLIPAGVIEGTQNVVLGGMKYSEFEIEPASAIDHVVYQGETAPLNSGSPLGEYPSGQRVRTVNPWASCLRRFESCLPHPAISAVTASGETGDTTSFERKLGRTNQVIIRPKRQMTLPKQPFTEAGMRVGDRMKVRAEANGRIVLERIEALVDALAT